MTETLKELEIPLKIDPGGTMPEIYSDEHELKVTFFLLDSDSRGTLLFHGLQIYKFGYPNEEAISGHRFYKLGLRPFHFFEVQNSKWISQIEKANRVHPFHKKELFAEDKHYVLPFHDTTIEVICNLYEFIDSR